MSRRSKARQVALQMLYQKDLNTDADPLNIREMIRERLDSGPLADFSWQLFAGVMENRGELDARITDVADNWALDRMAPTDRNTLRIGAYELLFTDTPHRVVIDEAIELAKKFGTKHSSQFVNGILDRLVPRQKRAED